LLLAGAAAVIFYLVNAVHYGQMPLRIEENEWPPMAEAVIESGEPIVTADETHRVRFNEDLTIDQSPIIGAWHPPLYVYAIGASTVVFGTDSPHMLRAVGVAGLLAAALLLLLIAREVTTRWPLIGGVAAILLLLHPYAIQGSVFLDIDTSVYAAAALLTIWLAIRYAKREDPLEWTHILALGGSLALVTWVKMPTTIVLVGVLVIWWLLSRRPFQRAIAEAASFVAVGAALFFSTYALWCLATGIAFSYTFDVTFAGKSSRLLSDLRLVENAAHWHLRWFGAAVILLGLVYLVDLLRHFWSERRLRPLDLPFLLSAAVLIQYVVLSPTDGTYQGKYAFSAIAAMLLPISWMLLRGRPERQPLAFWGGAVAIGLVAALLLPDMLTGLSYFGDYGSWRYELRLTAAAGAALLLAWWLGGRRGFAGGVVVVLAILLAAQTTRSYRADTSPMYPIPDTADFGAAASDINQTLRPGEIAVAPKDLGFYVEERVIEGEDAFARGDARLAAAIRRYPQITAFARDSFGPPVGPETEAVLARCFRDLRTFGTASVAYRSGDCG
jgi:hypothetical protein